MFKYFCLLIMDLCNWYIMVSGLNFSTTLFFIIRFPLWNWKNEFAYFTNQEKSNVLRTRIFFFIITDFNFTDEQIMYVFKWKIKIDYSFLSYRQIYDSLFLVLILILLGFYHKHLSVNSYFLKWYCYTLNII